MNAVESVNSGVSRGEIGPVLRAWLVPSEGAPRSLTWEEVRRWTPNEGLLWADLNRDSGEVQSWLGSDLGLGGLVLEALLEEETRPRWYPADEGLVVILRGVNLNAGTTPDDMIAVRCLFQQSRVITLRRFRMRALEDLAQNIENGNASRTPGGMLAGIVRLLTERMRPVVDNFDDLLADLEEEMLQRSERGQLSRLSALRQQVIRMRRYLGPQREVLLQLSQECPPPIGDSDRGEIRESADDMTRYVEELDAVRERSAITHEEVSGRMADQMNRAVYFISIVATIFLPLTVLTGLLGINVPGGMPLADNPHGFWIVCGVLVVLAIAVYALFRSRRML